MKLLFSRDNSGVDLSVLVFVSVILQNIKTILLLN